MITYRYKFRFEDNQEKEFAVNLDPETLSLIEPERPSYPEWTNLGFHQCPNCPLSLTKNKYCPVAKNLSELVDFFKRWVSFAEAEVTVQAPSRTYSKATTVQKGVSSLMGIFMVTSGCPVLDKLRPMVDTHLPFMTPEETTYRMLSMYLVAQYFFNKKSKKAEWEAKNFVRFLKEIQKVNLSFAKRLRSIPAKDASVNALVILNNLGEFTSLTLEQNILSRLERLFLKYWGQELGDTVAVKNPR